MSGIFKRLKKDDDDRTMAELTVAGIAADVARLAKEVNNNELRTSASRVNTEAVEEAVNIWPDPIDNKEDQMKSHQDNTIQDNTIQDNTVQDKTIKDNTIKDNVITINEQQSTETKRHPFYNGVQWFFVIMGPFLSVFDMGSDVLTAVMFFIHGKSSWGLLTFVFALAGLVGTHVFSYVWYRDDMKKKNPQTEISDLSNKRLVAFHLFGLAIFLRYHQLIKTALKERKEDHARLKSMAADLSMLAMIEAFLEGVPQLILQLYFMLGHDEKRVVVLRCVCMAFSFCSLTLALMKYQLSLHRFLPQVNEMCCLSTAVYLLYKLSTMTSHILSYCLLLILNTYSAIGLASIWVLGTIWAGLHQTKFCSGPWLEWLYRAIVGASLTFSYFDAKGQRTKISITFYYLFFSIIDVVAPVLLAMIKPEVMTTRYFLPVSCAIYVGTVFGLIGLCVYDSALHPAQGREESDSDHRMTKFIQP